MKSHQKDIVPSRITDLQEEGRRRQRVTEMMVVEDDEEDNDDGNNGLEQYGNLYALDRPPSSTIMGATPVAASLVTPTKDVSTPLSLKFCR